MKRYCGIVLAAGLVFVAASGARADIVTLTDAQQMGMARLNWTDGSEVLNGKTEILPAGENGVQYNITLGTSGDGKLAYGKWAGNYADWSSYEGFSLEFKLVSSTVADGTVEVANFLGDKGWQFRQTKADWPELSVGESTIVHIDFDDCIDGDSNAVSLAPADLNKIIGAGWQVITYDEDMLGATIELDVYPSTIVPEPGALVLLGAGGVALLALRLRRKR